MYEPTCPLCGKDMVLRNRRVDNKPFYGCSGYPDCRAVMTIRQVERKAAKLIASREVRLAWAEQMRNRLSKTDRVKYYEYLKSDKWKDKKKSLEQSSRYRCQLCNKGKHETTLHIHHRTYERLGYELPSDLIVLCADCHATHHDKLPRPPE